MGVCLWNIVLELEWLVETFYVLTIHTQEFHVLKILTNEGFCWFLKKKKTNPTGSHFIAQAGLEHIIYPRLVTLLVGLASISQILRLQAQAGPELTLQPSLALNSW